MALPDFAQTLRTFEEVSASLGRWLGAAQHEALKARLYAKSEQLHPRIMVFGLYNAGKSTLLNALMGRAEAKMADRPETSTVTEYTWGNYRLMDTPGIDAPIEHETVAEEQLKSCDVVLFVVAAGGATDEAGTWQRLVEIVARGRQVMLIVNNKAGIEDGGRDFQGVNDNLRRHMQAAGRDQGVDNILQKVPVHWVNAKSALRGQLENKPVLVAASGLPELQTALAQFLEQTDSWTMLAACRSELRLAIEQANGQLLQASNQRQGQALDTAQRQIESERARLLSTLNDSLDRDCRTAQREITGLIAEVANGHVPGNPTQAMESGADRIVKAVGENLTRALELELPISQQALNAIGTLAESSLKETQARLDANIPGDAPEEEGGFSPAFKAAFQKVPVGSVSEMTEIGVKAALELGKDLLPKLFKGIGPKTMGRWAGTAGRWAGPLVQVGTALYGVYEAVSAENAQRAAAVRKTQAIDDCARKFTDELRQAYRQQISEVVEQMFKPMNEWLAAKSSALVQHDREVEADQAGFAQALASLRAA